MQIYRKEIWTFSTYRALVLAALVIFHLGLVFRFRIVRLFSAEWIGYAVIGVIFSCIAITLLWKIRSGNKSVCISFPVLNFISSAWFKYALLISAIIIVILGLFWRLQVYTGTNIYSKMGDMLPLIDKATNTFLSGEYPYKVYKLPWRVTLTYMPGMWMPYLPAQLLDVDLRHTGLAFSAGTMALLLIASFKNSRDTEIMIGGWIVIVCFCLSPAIARFSINGHTYPLWFYISVFCFGMLRGYYKMAAIFFGLMLATRQTSIVYLPFVLVFFWRQNDWRSLTVCLAMMGFACSALCLPYAAIDFRTFLLDPMDAYNKMAFWDFQLGDRSYASRTIGFAYTIKTLGWMTDLSWIRYGLLILLPLIAWLCVKDTISLLVSMGAAGILFAIIAPVPWYYIYVPPILILSFAVLGECEPLKMMDDTGGLKAGA